MDVKKVAVRYNGILDLLSGTEHRKILSGSELDSENRTESMSDEELIAIMVNEMEWQLYRMMEPTMLGGEMKEDNPKEWRSILAKIQRFIRRYQ